MKRLVSSKSFGAFMSICTPANKGNNNVYNMDFQSMLELGIEEEDCCVEESDQMGEKKRRLSAKQVKELEKIFEVDNKLEPERKVKLAKEIGLQPRQVAIWFQNRRARYKTKQLERDYGLLNANYQSVKHNYDKLKQHNQALLNEIQELKSKLQAGSEEINDCIKEEANLNVVVSESDCKLIHDQIQIKPSEGSSDSDSSAILNEDYYTPNPIISSSYCSQSQSQFVKIEEHKYFFNGNDDDDDDHNCIFFSEEQAPTLQWYSPDQWN